KRVLRARQSGVSREGVQKRFPKRATVGHEEGKRARLPKTRERFQRLELTQEARIESNDQIETPVMELGAPAFEDRFGTHGLRRRCALHLTHDALGDFPEPFG